MSVIIGLDVGGSNTKIIGSVIDQNNKISFMRPLQVKANDPKTSVYGAFGRYISENGLSISDIGKIRITGVGASFVKENIYGVCTEHVDEFDALGRGGLFLSGLDNAVVISLGTGTAFVKADKTGNHHIGGTGVGGGTLIGLSSRLFDIRNFDNIIALASEGNLDNVDLTVGDISKKHISSMGETTTASNFGKVVDYASKKDIAKGLLNMIFQTVGVMAAFACKIDGTRDAVLCGNLSLVPDVMDYFNMITRLHDVTFHKPEDAEYATAIGATLN